jgi:hypothetical protein
MQEFYVAANMVFFLLIVNHWYQNSPIPFLYSRLIFQMRHGLFTKDDISKRDSTEAHRDLTFEGLHRE